MESMRYSIGEVARRCGVSVRTIRYYEEIDLLPAGTRNEANQRCYSDADVAHIESVLKLERLGFALKDIRLAYSLCHDQSDSLEQRYTRKLELLRERRRWLHERVRQLDSLLSGVDAGIAKVERAVESARTQRG